MRTRGTIKFIFWTAISALLVIYVFHSYRSGEMIKWYYYETKMDGFAVNTKTFKDASTEKPAVLQIGPAAEIEGLMAVPVKKGERLPINANGVIAKEITDAGKRAKVEGQTLKVTVPWEVKETKGFKYKDTFMHKGIKTNPWSGLWNVVMVIGLGLSLGLMAEGITDILGWKIEKIEHF